MSDGRATSHLLAQGRGVRLVAGVLALAADVIHFAVAPEHFREAVLFGTFMVVVGALQVSAGLLLIARPTRALVRALILGSMMVVAIYGTSRTMGLPFGPHPGQAEPIGPVDLLSKSIEVALLIVLAVLARSGRARRTPTP